MNDVVAVCVFECVTDLHCNSDDARELSWTCLRKTWSLDQFHYQKRKAACFADVVNRDDVWMIQCRGCARLPHETFAAIGSLARGGENFNRDFAPELEIRGAKDCAHAAATELTIEPVAFAQDCAGSGDSRRAQIIRKDERLLGVEHVLRIGQATKKHKNISHKKADPNQ